MNETLFSNQEKIRAQRECLLQERIDIIKKRVSMKAQMNKAQAKRISTGKYSDAKWFARLKTALDHSTVRLSEIDHELRLLKQEELSDRQRIAITDEEIFVEVANERLPPQAVYQIWEEVWKRAAQRKESLSDEPEN